MRTTAQQAIEVAHRRAKIGRGTQSSHRQEICVSDFLSLRTVI